MLCALSLRLNRFRFQLHGICDYLLIQLPKFFLDLFLSMAESHLPSSGIKLLVLKLDPFNNQPCGRGTQHYIHLGADSIVSDSDHYANSALYPTLAHRQWTYGRVECSIQAGPASKDLFVAQQHTLCFRPQLSLHNYTYRSIILMAER